MIDTAVLDDTRRQLRDRLRTLPLDGDARLRTYRLRAMLEEMGVHCDDTAELQDVDAVLLTSARGTEALIAARLDDDARLRTYARIVARAARRRDARPDRREDRVSGEARHRLAAGARGGCASSRSSPARSSTARLDARAAAALRGRAEAHARLHAAHGRPLDARRLPPLERLLVQALEHVPPLALAPRRQQGHRPHLRRARPRPLVAGH